MTKAFTCFFLASLVFSIYLSVKNWNPPATTNPSLEKDYTITKMNQYPIKLRRLANIIENRKEAKAYFKLEKNFTNIFNFKLLVNNYLQLFLLLLSLGLIVKFFIISPKIATIISLPPLISLTLIGPTREIVSVAFLPLILVSIYALLWPKRLS